MAADYSVEASLCNRGRKATRLLLAPVSLQFFLRNAGYHRHEHHRDERRLARAPICPGDLHQFLGKLFLAYGPKKDAAGFQLINKSLRHFGHRRREQNAIERRLLGPASKAVAVARYDVVELQLPEPGFGLAEQRLVPLDRVDHAAELGEHRRLIARAGTDLEHAMIWLHI